MVVCYGICWCAHTNPYILLYYHGIDRFLLFPFLLRVPIRNRTKKIWPKIPQMSHYNIILHMIFWAHFPISHLGDSFIPAFFYFFFPRCFCKVLKLDIGILYEKVQVEEEERKNTESYPPIHKQFCVLLFLSILPFAACLLHFSFRYILTMCSVCQQQSLKH